MTSAPVTHDDTTLIYRCAIKLIHETKEIQEWVVGAYIYFILLLAIKVQSEYYLALWYGIH